MVELFQKSVLQHQLNGEYFQEMPSNYHQNPDHIILENPEKRDFLCIYIYIKKNMNKHIYL